MFWSLLRFTECVVGGPRYGGHEDEENSVMLKRFVEISAVAALVLGLGVASWSEPAAADRGGAVAVVWPSAPCSGLVSPVPTRGHATMR